MSRTLNNRLPAALTALALQAGLFALLLLSFEAVRRLPPEKETTLFLPPLPRPKPKPALVIDGRPLVPLRPSATPPSRTAPPTPPAANGDSAILRDLGALTGGARAPSGCVPQEQAERGSHAPCPRPGAQTGEIPLNPDSHVKDEAHWAQEWEREHSDYLPGVTAGEHDIHVSLYNSNGPSLLGGYRTPAPYSTHAHASDADFQKALAAWQEREKTRHARPAPPAAAGAAP